MHADDKVVHKNERCYGTEIGKSVLIKVTRHRPYAIKARSCLSEILG